MNRQLAALAILAVILSGCLQPATKLGCCLKENATDRDGCVLYNDSSDQILDWTGKTNLEADGQKCNVTGNYCNVTFDDDQPGYLIPVCTEADILSCRQPDCLAMVCGDFKFKPPVAPGITAEGDDVKTDVPADTQEESAMQFFHAQCRFLPMDGKLKKIMKSSKSTINVFRWGVGNSFDEYEQYRYYFPMSDKFCAVNPPRENELRVDRYMNYLNPTTKAAWDPIAGITSNCIEDDASAPPPFSYDESGRGVTTGTFTGIGGGVSYSYFGVTKDKSNYKFAHWGRVDYGEVEESYFTGYSLASPFFSSFSVYKKIDNSYYKKWLSITSASTIYGLSTTLTNTTRAPFECDLSSIDCYSGICSTTTYNRVVMLTPPNSNGVQEEVVTDCESYTDENLITKLVCAPTKSVTITGPNTAPTRTYAKIDARVVHVDGLSRFESVNAACGIFDSQHLDKFVDWEYMGGWGYGAPWDDVQCPNVMSSNFFTAAQAKFDVGQITNTATGYMTYFNGTDGLWYNQFQEASAGPPAGGALFFGYTDPEASYGGKTVIGYALATQDEVDDLLVVKNCEMVSGVDYEIVSVPDDLTQWGALKNAFTGYFRQRYSGMKAVSTGDSCGAVSCTLYEDAPQMACAYFPDFFFAGLPWVVTMDKQAHPNYWGGNPTQGILLNNEIQMGTRKINRFSENMVITGGADTCTLRRMHSGWYSTASRESDDTNYYIWLTYQKPTYDLLYSKKIALFYDDGDGMIGKCAIDGSTGLPQVRTFGWCEPCTTSTIAYQFISTRGEGLYMPAAIAEIEGGGNADVTALEKRVCTATGGEIQCANNLITSANDFSIGDGEVPLNPRTYPEASVLKERLGNYMKSGVLPVLDLSVDDNWVADEETGNVWELLFGDDGGDGSAPAEYDFQRLVGNMGAAVVIVERVDNETDAEAKAQNISDRSSAVRSRCYGCLTAFHVNSPESNTSFHDTAHAVFSTNFASKFTVDMVTFDYPISDHTGMLPAMGSAILAQDPSANLTYNYSQIIADDIASYSRGILKAENKPTMLVGLNLDSDDSVMTASRYKALFDAIALNQDDYVKAGLIGIIYSPARQQTILTFEMDEVGIVDMEFEDDDIFGLNGYGVKNDKFCALQGAMQKLTAAPPVAVYVRSNAVNDSECIPCLSLEKSQGQCDADALMCDNGIHCTPPGGLSLSDIEGAFRCQPETIVDDPAGERCTLCKDIPGTYTCTFRYANGSIETQSGSMAVLESDAYLDILAGIERPYKCCLADSYDQRHSYVKRSSESLVNVPIAFSKTGDEEVDCGMSSSIGAITEAQEFCNVEIPIRNYDVTCTISG